MKPEEFDPGPLARVSHHPSGNRSMLVFVRDFDHAPQHVWNALTDPDMLSRWAPFTADRSLASPGPVILRMLDGSDRDTIPGKVIRAEAPAILEYTWGDDTLVWELSGEHTDTGEDNGDGEGKSERERDGTRLTLRHSVESPDTVPVMAAGWHLCLVVADYLLGGTPIGPIVGTEAMRYGWQRLHDQYAEALGISEDR